MRLRGQIRQRFRKRTVRARTVRILGNRNCEMNRVFGMRESRVRKIEKKNGEMWKNLGKENV